jgi:hypothetical protein
MMLCACTPLAVWIELEIGLEDGQRLSRRAPTAIEEAAQRLAKQAKRDEARCRPTCATTRPSSARPHGRMTASARVRAAHGRHPVRDCRCRREAELERAAGAGEPDRRAMAVRRRKGGRGAEQKRALRLLASSRSDAPRGSCWRMASRSTCWAAWAWTDQRQRRRGPCRPAGGRQGDLADDHRHRAAGARRHVAAAAASRGRDATVATRRRHAPGLQRTRHRGAPWQHMRPAQVATPRGPSRPRRRARRRSKERAHGRPPPRWLGPGSGWGHAAHLAAVTAGRGAWLPPAPRRKTSKSAASFQASIEKCANKNG